MPELVVLQSEDVDGKVRLTPAADRYDIDIDIRFTHTRLLQVAGADDTISEDGRRFHARVRVEDQPVDILLFPERRNSGSTWEVRGGPARPGSPGGGTGVWLGQFPLERTTAIPLYRPVAAPAPADPVLVLSHETDRFSAEFRAGVPATFELELRHERLDHAKTFEGLGGTGFSKLVMTNPPVYDARAENVLTASIVVGHGRGESFRLLTRIDGRWPDAERVAIDGRAVDAEVVAFEIPWPLDKRVTTLLLAGPGPREPGPGALQIWLDSAAGGALTIDPDLLDDEALRQLRTLGYIDDPDDG